MKNKKLSIPLLSIDVATLVMGVSLLVVGLLNQVGYSVYIGALCIILSDWLGWKIWKECLIAPNRRVENTETNLQNTAINHSVTHPGTN